MLRQRDNQAVSDVVPAFGMDFDLDRSGCLASPPYDIQARRGFLSVLSPWHPAQVAESPDVSDRTSRGAGRTPSLPLSRAKSSARQQANRVSASLWPDGTQGQHAGLSSDWTKQGRQ